jgi:hypothetical protein
MDPVWPAPVDPDEDGDDDAVAVGDADDEVVDALDVPAVEDGPFVDASATPVAPAPTPAAMTPVMMSRRARPPTLETIRFLPSLRPAARVRPTRLRRSACIAVLADTRSLALSEL